MQSNDRSRERVSFALAALAVLLGASAFGKVAGFYFDRSRTQDLRDLAHGTRDANDLKRCLGEAKKAAETLKQNNLFVKMPPKEHPVKQVEGIFGSEAFIAGKWYKVGERIGDAKIVAINATDVKIEWNGKETSFSPMASSGRGGPGAPPGLPTPMGGPRPMTGPQPPRPPEARMARPEPPRPAENDPLAWMGVKLSPKMRAILMEKWNNASPEEREKGQQEWNKLSDEQKQQMMDQMEQRT